MASNITKEEIKYGRRTETERSDKIIYVRLHEHDIYICDYLCGKVINIYLFLFIQTP